MGMYHWAMMLPVQEVLLIYGKCQGLCLCLFCLPASLIPSPHQPLSLNLTYPFTLDLTKHPPLDLFPPSSAHIACLLLMLPFQPHWQRARRSEAVGRGEAASLLGSCPSRSWQFLHGSPQICPPPSPSSAPSPSNAMIALRSLSSCCSSQHHLWQSSKVQHDDNLIFLLYAKRNL